MTGSDEARCGSMDGPLICGRRPARRYINGYRCPEHTPARLAGLPEPDPPYVGSLAWFLERAGRTGIATPLSASQLIDDRAVASGKSRRGAHAYAEARLREEIRRAGPEPAPEPAPEPVLEEPPGLWDPGP